MMGGRERMQVMLLVLMGVTVAALTLGPLMGRVLSEQTHRVKSKDYEVVKDDDIDYDDEEEVAPEQVESLAGGKIKIISKTFKPPTDAWRFKAFGYGTHVDIETDPESLSPSRHKDTPTEIKISVAEVPSTAAQFPLKGEGNLKPPPGGEGYTPHWSAKMGRAAVDIREEKQSVNWWPQNNKLVVSATHPVVADGTPSSDAHFVWKYDEIHEDWFEHNDTEKNFLEASPEHHKADFTAPSEATGAEEKDQNKVSVQYKLHNKPTDEEPLNITAPRFVSSSKTRHDDVKSISNYNTTSDPGFNLFAFQIPYSVWDQFGEIISQTDLGKCLVLGEHTGEKRLVIKEKLRPLDSTFTYLKTYLNSDEFGSTEQWKASSDLEGDGVFADSIFVVNITWQNLIQGLGRDPTAGDVLAQLDAHTHDWFVNVGSYGDPANVVLGNDELQIAENPTFLVKVKSFSRPGDGNVVNMAWTIEYVVHLVNEKGAS